MVEERPPDNGWQEALRRLGAAMREEREKNFRVRKGGEEVPDSLRNFTKNKLDLRTHSNASQAERGRALPSEHLVKQYEEKLGTDRLTPLWQIAETLWKEHLKLRHDPPDPPENKAVEDDPARAPPGRTGDQDEDLPGKGPNLESAHKPRGAPETSDHRRKVLAAVLTCALVLAVVVALTLLAGDDGDHPSPLSSSATPGNKVDVRPEAVALAGNGALYIAEPALHQVRVVGPDGTVVTLAGTPGRGGKGADGIPAQESALSTPRGVAVGSDGTVYVADTGNRRVRTVKGGIIETVKGTEDISEPYGLAVGPDNDLYVSDKATHLVWHVRKDGTVEPVGNRGPDTLNFPHGIAMDSGTLYIADRNNHVVRKVELGRTTGLITFAGTGRETGPSGDGGPATGATLSHPVAVAVSRGDVYVVESGNKRIRRVRSDGTITTISTGDMTLNLPTGIAVDPNGVIYVADSDRLIQIEGDEARPIPTHSVSSTP